jgi:Subtilase family
MITRIHPRDSGLAFGKALSLLTIAVTSSLAVGQLASQNFAAPKLLSDPRLVTPLIYLRDAVPQRRAPASPQEREAIHRSVVAGPVPKIVADALHSRMMVIDANAEVQTYIECDSLDPGNVAALENLGVRIELKGAPDFRQRPGAVFRHVPTLQAEIPVEVLQQVESLSFIRFIRLPDYAQSNGIGSVTTQGDAILQAAAVRSDMNVSGTGVRIGVISSGIAGIFAANCAACGPTTASPSPMSLGDLPMGTGTRNASGVLTSVTPLASSSQPGSLSAGQSYQSNLDLEHSPDGTDEAEGTAMLEIVHHLAPGAALSFANASTGMEFEYAVNALAQSNDIVVDDKYFMEPSFDGSSPVSLNTADALNNDTNPIRAYITSGGNLALNHYMGTWSQSAIDGGPYTAEPGWLHQFSAILPSNATASSPATTDTGGFGTGGSSPTFDPVVVLRPDESVTVFLAWNDALNGSSNDYDLFLVQLSCPSSVAGPGTVPTPPCTMTAGTPLEQSTNRQTGTQDPYESLSYTNKTPSNVSVGIVIQNYNNQAKSVVFDMFIGGTYEKGNSVNHNFNTVTSSVPAQSDSVGSPASVISVGAINQSQCLTAGNCSGELEGFSSEGPTQATPQDQNAGVLKPNLVAVDGVCVTGADAFGANQASPNECQPTPNTYTPRLFFGTSAAAPHVAAIAGLMLNMAPCLIQNEGIQTPAQERMLLYEALTGGSPPGSTAPKYPFANMLSGYYYATPNDVEGYGLANALAAATGLLPSQATPMITTQPASTMSSNPSISEGFLVVSGTSASSNLVNLSGCPIDAIKWSSPPSQCISGSATATQATIECPAGVNAVSLDLSVNGGTSYLPQTEVQSANAIVTDFSLTASAYSTPPVLVTPGSPVLFEVLVTSSPQGGFTNPVSLACASGLPPGAECMFSAITVTPSASTSTVGTASSTLTIYTAGVAQRNDAPGEAPNPARRLPGVFAGLLLMFGLSRAPGKYRRTRRYLMMFPCSVAGLCLVSCSSATSKGATPNSYTVTITGTSNQVVHSTTVSFAIN